MNSKYMLYPIKVKDLANELITVCNDYKARRINNSELREIILFFASTHHEKLFNGDDLNPTVKKIIGKKRINLINKILDTQ